MISASQFSIAASVSARRFLFVSERALKAKRRGCARFLCLGGAAGVDGGGAGSGSMNESEKFGSAQDQQVYGFPALNALISFAASCRHFV
jgi:hypothetical protein